jgi:two-component system, NtrC family, nitrogen regulation sensor histidine kinase NtrY
MTIALRLLLAFCLLSLVATGLVGVGLREAWRRAEEERFSFQLEGAKSGVLAELRWEAATLRDLLEPVCKHDAFIDQTLIDIEKGELDSGRRLAITQLVREEMKALKLDELTFFTAAGEILGAGHDPAAAGKVDTSLRAQTEARAPSLAARTEPAGGRSAFVIRCAKRRGAAAVGLLGARHLAPILARIGSAYGARLDLAGTPGALERPGERTAIVELPDPDLAGTRISAAVSREPLERNLALLDRRILVTSAAALAVAVIAAILLARSQARPIEALAQQAREVVRGEPRPVEAKGGGRELEQFALAFNQAIGDLVSLRKQLAATERIAARREVARHVAHEIKNPLAPIRAAVETLRRLRERADPAFDEYFDEATRTVLGEVHRISKIVSEFTDYARLPPPNPGPVEIADVARSVVSLYTAGGAGVSLDIAACPTIRADRDQIVQVLTNLIQNGLEAAGLDGPKAANVAVKIEPIDRDRLAITVRDDGPGVSPEMLPRLFEPYATSKPAGSGLGLAIVERIVQEHGGEITYEPQARGALFRVTLPFAGPTHLRPAEG